MFTGSKTEKWLKAIVFIGLLVLIVIIFSQKIEFTSVDLGRHLENGKIVWQDSGVLFRNFYSYTEPNTSFINHHWLAGVIYYGTYLIGGFNLLSILNILIILGTFGLAFRLAQKKAGFYLAAVLSIPVIYLLSERVEVRPEIFSYFFIILTWFILESATERKNYRLLYWLIPLFILWVNIHIYFFIGLALLGFKAMSEFLPIFISTSGDFKTRILSAWAGAKVWIINLGLLFIACLINPNFIRGLLYPFNIFRNYGYEIAENKSIFYLQHLMINNNIPLFKILLVLVIVSIAASFFFTKKLRLFSLISGVFFSLLALSAVRNLSIFALAALIVASENLSYPFLYLRNNISYLNSESRNKFRPYLASGLMIIIIASIFYLISDAKNKNYFMKNSLGWGLSRGSEDSIKFFKDNKLSGLIFNNYDLGSALIFWLYPQEKVFVDNRPEAYSNSFFSDTYRPMQQDKNAWLEASKKYEFKTIYFSYTDGTPWAQTFLSQTIDDKWVLVYFDRYTVIFLNKDKYNAAQIAKLTLSSREIRTRLRELAASSNLRGKNHLANLATLMNQPDIAIEIYQGIIFSNPSDGSAFVSLGSVYAASADRTSLTKALAYFKLGLNEGYKLPAVYNQMGLVSWQMNDYLTAEKDWHLALKIDRKNISANYYLDQINQLRKQGKIN